VAAPEALVEASEAFVAAVAALVAEKPSDTSEATSEAAAAIWELEASVALVDAVVADAAALVAAEAALEKLVALEAAEEADAASGQLQRFGLRGPERHWLRHQIDYWWQRRLTPVLRMRWRLRCWQLR